MKLKELESKLNSLLTKRHKRGLIDGVGHAIKFITGNMDASDAQEINQQIRELGSNQDKLRTTLSEDHKINLAMAKRFDNITSHINDMQGTIELFLNRNANQTTYFVKNTETTIREIQYLNQVNYNIDILTSHIKDISEAIILAKLNIIPKLILHIDEIQQISQYLENQSIKTKSVENIYEILGLQAYYNESNIIFNIQVPNLDPNSYQFYHIIPLPINETKTIIIEPYVLYNEFKIIYATEKCPKIENIYFCSKFKNAEATSSSRCIGQLFKNQDANCVINDTGKIQSIWQPEPNLILFINVPKTKIETTCETNNHSIEGTTLVHYKNCEINVNNITYNDDINTFWEDIYIAPAPIAEIHASVETQTITLKRLSEYDIKQQAEITTISYRMNAHDLVESLMWIATIGTSIFILKQLYLQRVKQDVHAEAVIPSIPQLQTRGGGVTYSPTTALYSIPQQQCVQ